MFTDGVTTAGGDATPVATQAKAEGGNHLLYWFVRQWGHR